MSQHKHEISFSGSMPLDTVIGYLEGLVESMKEGTVCVERSDEFLSLTPGAKVDLTVKAKQKGDKETISFELKWENHAEEGDEFDLRISSEVPEADEEEDEEEEEEDD